MEVWIWLNRPWLQNSHFAIAPLGIAELIFLPILLNFAARSIERLIIRRGQRNAHVDQSAAYALSKVTYYSIMVLGGLAILNEVGINILSLAAFAGALGVGIGIGLQNLAKNFLAGLTLLFGRLIRPGDRIEWQTNAGDVESIGLTSTLIVTTDDARLIVPNSLLVEQPVTNWTLQPARRLLSTQINLGFDVDPEKIQEILEGAARATPGVLESPAPSARLVGFTDIALTFKVLFWTTDDVLFPQRLSSDVNFAILRQFREGSLGLPYPQHPVAASPVETAEAVPPATPPAPKA